jgi:acyl carrier protein
MDEVKQKIRNFVISNFLFGQGDSLKNDASFLDNGIVDSTGVLELVAFVESEFGFKVPDVDLLPQNFDSVNALSDYVSRAKAAH